MERQSLWSVRAKQNNKTKHTADHGSPKAHQEAAALPTERSWEEHGLPENQRNFRTRTARAWHAVPAKAMNLLREQDSYTTLSNMFFINTQGFPTEEKKKGKRK